MCQGTSRLKIQPIFQMGKQSKSPLAAVAKSFAKRDIKLTEVGQS
ncbi:hypothetical protein ANASTE_00670 [Anaerofustis stercorihominis DSM 17244]|uniref:Uncharacterized protein n=1 Tax=Anaerofustis stercorihominis DSM 17244 TaxID=445971 RepID=B1C7G8_9FIRM|nr:hypothetical protein ANASTE_00670 [Anaerofustis stercorihominis DSM 17244]